MYKNIFKSIVLLSSFQAVAQQTPNDVSENYFTENDTVKTLNEVVINGKNNPSKSYRYCSWWFYLVQKKQAVRSAGRYRKNRSEGSSLRY